jgi:hypothetical protein
LMRREERALMRREERALLRTTRHARRVARASSPGFP